jgi:hypothetical protein
MVNEPLPIVVPDLDCHLTRGGKYCCFSVLQNIANELHLMQRSDQVAIGGEADMVRPQLIATSQGDHLLWCTT